MLFRFEYVVPRIVLFTGIAQDGFDVDDFTSIPGKGARGTVNGKEVMVVSPGYLEENEIEAKDKRLDQFWSEGKTVVFVLIDSPVLHKVCISGQYYAFSNAAVFEVIR